jgi:glycosyltransferase involved in cell wall biosynthesis
MKILYITQTYLPESSTTRCSEQAFFLNKFGCKVTILTTMPSYPFGKINRNFRKKLFIRETIQDIDVIRVWTIPTPNRGILLRSISYISFFITSTIVGIFLPKYDFVMARVPSIGTELAGVIISKLKRSKFLLEMEDIIPDNLYLIGILSTSKLAKILRAYYNLIYKLIDFVIVPGVNMSEMLEQRGVASNQIILLPNAANSEMLDTSNSEKVRRRFNLNNKFVAVYTGSFSSYYGVPNIVDAAILLQKRLPQFRLLLVGSGSDQCKVSQMIKDNNLDNVIQVNAVAPSEIGEYLQSADLFIYSLVGENIPKAYQEYLSSKACEYLMIGKPIIAIESVPVCGNFLKKIGAGLSVPAYQPLTLAEKISFYANNRVELLNQGKNARLFAKAHLERKQIVEAFFMKLKPKMSI